MSTNNNSPLQDKLRAVRSWEDLKKVVTLDEAVKSLIASEKSRIHHKRAYLKRQLILQKAKEAGITADV